MRTILTADIGGTTCRFGLFVAEGDQLTLERQIWRPTAAFTNTDELLAACTADLALPLREADALILAVAGPILNPQQARTTNAALTLDLRPVVRQQGRCSCAIINDFTAQAHACRTEAGTAARQILPLASTVPPSELDSGPDSEPDGVAYSRATKAVLGAGTGFGTASLVCDSAGVWLALPAEGGHTGFPFVGAEEAAFREYIEQERAQRGAAHTQVVCEEVLSGRGLALLHRFLTGESCSPAEVGRRALGQDSATLRLFARFYGRMCRNWAFVTLCRGGLYIAGGIAAKNPLTVTCPAFAEALFSTDYLVDWLRELPVFLLDGENSGLWGAARYGLDCLVSARTP